MITRYTHVHTSYNRGPAQYAALLAVVELCGEPCEALPQAEACRVVTAAMGLHRAVLCLGNRAW